MKKVILSVLAISLALPATAQNQARMTEAELIEMATAQETCGEDKVPTSARYENDSDNRVLVTCNDAEGFVLPLAVGLGLGGGAAGAAAAALAAAGVAAAAGGRGGSTPDTQ